MKMGESKNLIIKLKLPKLLVRSLDRVARRRGIRRGRLIASLLADWVEDYVEDRFEILVARSDRIGLVDKLLGEMIPVSVIKGELTANTASLSLAVIPVMRRRSTQEGGHR